jgi:hypothetical protein
VSEETGRSNVVIAIGVAVVAVIVVALVLGLMSLLAGI